MRRKICSNTPKKCFERAADEGPTATDSPAIVAATALGVQTGTVKVPAY